MRYVHRHGKRIAVDTLITGTPTRRRKPFAVRFVKLPDYWIEKLQQSNNPGTLKLALRILKEAFKRQYLGGEIVLSTEVTRLSRKVRLKAVKELVKLGLIEIEQTGNQATRVISIIEKKKKNKAPVGSRRNAAYPQRERGVPPEGTRRTGSVVACFGSLLPPCMG
jgi:hypothetical protein